MCPFEDKTTRHNRKRRKRIVGFYLFLFILLSDEALAHFLDFLRRLGRRLLERDELLFAALGAHQFALLARRVDCCRVRNSATCQGGVSM